MSQLVSVLVSQDQALGGHGAFLRPTGPQAKYQRPQSQVGESPPIKIFAETTVRSRFLKNQS